MLSKSSLHVLAAYEKGYKVQSNGTVLSHLGRKLSLSTNKSGTGYLYFSIKHNKKRCIVFVHKMQAFQKFGMIALEPNTHVRHLNGNSLDNSWDNLDVGSQSDNMLDIPKETRLRMAAAGAAVQRKLTEEEIRSLRRDRLDGLTYRQLTQKYNIAKSTISYIVNSKTYRSIA